jgi:hypothetical protein
MEKTDISRLSPEKQAVIRGILVRMKELKYSAKEIMSATSGSQAYSSHYGQVENRVREKSKETYYHPRQARQNNG